MKKEAEAALAAEAEAERLRIEEEDRVEDERRRQAKEDEEARKKHHATHKSEKTIEAEKRAAEKARQAKLAAYGITDSKEEMAAKSKAKAERIAKEHAAKAEKEAAQQAALEAAQVAEEAERKRQEELATAPLVDDWMTAADDWSQINVEALAMKVPMAEQQEAEQKEARLKQEAEVKERQEAEAKKKAAHELSIKGNSLISDEMAVFSEETNPLRSPICCVLGHVDVGKTKLLDYMRKTHVQDGEAGGITQQIGATFFPASKLEDAIAKVAARKKLSLEVPGLLIIDTPGHESFANLRSRGSGLCDLAILVIDLVVGIEKQTIESIGLLKMRKTPFVIALNKLDRIYEWKSAEAGSSAQNFKKQVRTVEQDFQAQVNRVIVQMAEQGLNAELYWKNKDVKSTISMIPTSAHTGEGVPDLLMVISQITQKFLQERITYGDDIQATVLEVKPLEGLGTTCDVILVNGMLNRGDRIVLCGLNGPIVSTIRTLLTPQPMKELRVKTPYQQHDRIRAAQGLKVLAHGHDADKAIPGSPMYVVRNDKEEEIACAAVMEDFEKLRSSINKEGTGVYVQSSTLGSLEALLHFLKASKIPVVDFGIGPVAKVDVIKASCMHERKKPEFAVILAFDVKINEDARKESVKLKVKIFEADIIYHLEDDFKAYLEEIEDAKRAAAAEDAVFPVQLEILPEHIFNTKDPIIMGCRVIKGQLRPGTPICVPGKGNLRLGRVSKIEMNHVEKQKAKVGDEVAVSIEPGGLSVMYGRQFDAKDKLYSYVSRRSINALKAFFAKELTAEDVKLLVKLKKKYQID